MTCNRIIANEGFYPTNVTPTQEQADVHKREKHVTDSIINKFYTLYTDLK
jgi:hypothetical protein